LELPSEPAVFGAIQVTPNGTPIILGPDGPTIGGYPKPYVVCQADLPKLAHLRTGQSVPLEMIQLEMARIANIESGQQMDKFISELEIALTGDFQP
jgi:allophanate hydrolase subunit 2